MTLTDLLDTLDPDAPLAQRHLWLMDALRWVRGEGEDPQASVGRVRQLLATVREDPAWLARWHRWWARFLQTVDLTPLLADFGFAPRTAFMSELGHRLRRKLLPGTPETRDLAELNGQLLRLLLVPLGHLLGRLPLGNTGRANISAFQPMAVTPKMWATIRQFQSSPDSRTT